MTQTKSGLILLGIGVAMNVVGRLVPQGESHSLVLAIFFVAWMTVSLVLGLLGIFRIIAGAIKRTK